MLFTRVMRASEIDPQLSFDNFVHKNGSHSIITLNVLPSSAQVQAQSPAWGWDSLNLTTKLNHHPPTNLPIQDSSLEFKQLVGS